MLNWDQAARKPAPLDLIVPGSLHVSKRFISVCWQVIGASASCVSQGTRHAEMLTDFDTLLSVLFNMYIAHACSWVCDAVVLATGSDLAAKAPQRP